MASGVEELLDMLTHPGKKSQFKVGIVQSQHAAVLRPIRQIIQYGLSQAVDGILIFFRAKPARHFIRLLGDVSYHMIPK